MSKTKNAPIKPHSARNHNAAPLSLINPTSDKKATIGLDLMTYEQLEEFGEELNTVRQRVLDDLGQKDADYIRRVIRAQKASEVLGRIGIFMTQRTSLLIRLHGVWLWLRRLPVIPRPAHEPQEGTQ